MCRSVVRVMVRRWPGDCATLGWTRPGAGTPPTPFNTEAELVEYVKKTKGAIGYIDSGTSHSGVKVIEVR